MKIKIELEPNAWHNLSMRDRAKYIHNSVLNHFANGGSMTDISIDDIRHLFNDGGKKDIYAKANAILDERIKQKMMENRPSYEDWINNERNKVTQAAFEYSNQRTSPSYIMLDNPYKTEEEWTSAMDSIIAERQKELNDSIKLNMNQPPMILQMNISVAQLKLDDAIWEKNLGYSSKIPANSCLTTATDNYVQVTGDKSYGANLNSYFQNNHPGYEVVPGFEEAALGDIVLLLEDNGEAKHGMIYAGLNDLGQYIFNNSAGGPDDIAYLKGISFHSINRDKNPNDHVLILRFVGNDKWNKEKEEDYNLRYPAFMLGGNLFDEGEAEKDEKKTLFEPIEHPVIPKVPSDQDTMNWLANWYNNRRKQLYNNRIQARKNLLTYSSLPSSISDLINNYEIGRTELNKLYYRKLNSLAYPVTIPVPEEEYYTTRFYGNSGVNKGDTIFINYNHVTPNSKQELETKVHERVHSLLDPGYFRGFNELTDITNDILVPKETPSSEYDKYLNDGREGYPRLMEFRRIHDIDPNKVWNVEEVKQLLELDEKDKEEHQLYKWTPESVTKALNEVAYRNQNNAITQAANGGILLSLFNNRGNLFLKGGPKETLEGNSPADLMRNDNIGFLQGYYPEVTIPKLSLYEAADNSGITLVPYLGDAVDAMQAANLAKEGKYTEAAILGSTLLIPNILEKPLKFLGTKALKYFGKGIENAEDLMKLSDDDWYHAYKTALYHDDKEGAKTILELRILTKKESGLEVMPFKTNLEKLYVLKPSFIRDYETYKNLFWNWDLDRDYFHKKYKTTIGNLRKRYDNLKVQDSKRGQKLLEDISANEIALKLEIDLAVKEGKIPETFLEDLEFYTKDTYGIVPEYDSDKHLILAPWKNELKLTITTDPQTGQLIYDLLPIHLDSKYRYVGKDAYEDYVSRGIVSNIDNEGKALTRHSFPMFTSRNPSSFGFDYNKIWLVSKPDAPLEWESVIGAAITPVYKGETNKTPLSMFDIFLESSEGFRKLLSFGGTLLHLFNDGGNTLTNEALPKNAWRKDSSNKLAYIKDLDEWIAKNPTFKGSNGTIYNTADFRDMFILLVGHESSYNPNASSGSYTGYYLIHKNENPNLNQHTRAFKHIDRLFLDNITDYDLKKAKELGINLAALLMKYWNQGNHVNNYLHNGIDHEDGVGTKISLYGNDMDADFDMTNYVSKAITDNYALVPKGGNLWNIAKLARNKNITNYADLKNLITAYNQERNTSFDSKKLLIGDTIWLIPTNISEKPILKIKTLEISLIDSKVNYDNPQGLPWYNVLLDNIKRTFGWEPPEGRYDFAKGGYLNNRYKRY